MSAYPFSLSRRNTLLAGALAALGPLLPATAQALPTPSSALDPLLASIAEELLQLAPEAATGLGLDRDARSGLKSRLADLSPEGRERWVRQVRSMQARLASVDRGALPGQGQLQLDSLQYAVSSGLQGARFAYGPGAAGGVFGGAAPYVVSQQDGALTSVPEFLDAQHQIHDASDAEAYLARVSAFARQLDQETARIRHDAALGVSPPLFLADKALRQLRGFRAKPATSQRLVASLAERTARLGLAGDWWGRCTRLVERSVYPAIDRQIAAVAAAAAHAAPGAGVQRLPDGDAYYAWALRLGTTTSQTAAQIHQIGLDQNEALKARIDALLRKQGLNSGTVGERVRSLNGDARFLYPDTDAGRAELIAYLNDCIARIRPLLPALSHLGLKADVTVKRVPPDIEDGAALGYMNFAALDGSRPAIYYVNLKSTELWPKYQLASLTAHEGVPGHTWQGAFLAEHHQELPLTASLLGFNAFVEGWALYAEQLVAEQGLYADDPWGEIGYLQAQQFRACRLVADTGLHALGWSREQTVRFLVEQTGRGEAAMTSETDRYCASPGQACGYKTGHNEILRLRALAQSRLQSRFDLAAFNDALVATGGVPLTVLQTAVNSFIDVAQG